MAPAPKHSRRWFQFGLSTLLVLMGVVALWMAARPTIEDYVFGDGDPCESGVGFRVDFGCYRDSDEESKSLQKGHLVLSAGFRTQLYLIVIRFHPGGLAWSAAALIVLLAWHHRRRRAAIRARRKLSIEGEWFSDEPPRTNHAPSPETHPPLVLVFVQPAPICSSHERPPILSSCIPLIHVGSIQGMTA